MMPISRARFLTFVDNYLPGYKYGGPIRAVRNVVQALAEHAEFHIVTRDRDLGDVHPFRDVPTSWSTVEGAQVLYVSPNELSVGGIGRIVRGLEFDGIYLNSFFSRLTSKVLLLRRLGRLPDIPIVVAPRGELAPAALAIRAGRKRAFMRVARATGLYDGVTWQACSDHEAADIHAMLPRFCTGPGNVAIAPDFPAPSYLERYAPRPMPKEAGRLDMVFVGRLTPMKNLLGALRLLGGVSGHVTFDIYGPIGDERYWAKCEALIADLPSNVQVAYRGMIHHTEVGRVLAAKDVFFLPTLGENYGHAIIEALGAGCPILISDRTPWRALEESGVGWDVALHDTARYCAVIDELIAMDATRHEALRRSALAYAQRVETDPVVLEQNRLLFSATAQPSAAMIPLTRFM